MERTIEYSDLSPLFKGILHEANFIRGNAFNQYSRHVIGAAILTIDNKKYSANYPGSEPGAPTAEEQALAKAIADGNNSFKAVALIGTPEGKEFVTPCKAFLREVSKFFLTSKQDIDIIMASSDMKKITIKKLSKII